MITKKAEAEDYSVTSASCLSVSFYVHGSLLSVAHYPKALQRYEENSN